MRLASLSTSCCDTHLIERPASKLRDANVCRSEFILRVRMFFSARWSLIRHSARNVVVSSAGPSCQAEGAALIGASIFASPARVTKFSLHRNAIAKITAVYLVG